MSIEELKRRARVQASVADLGATLDGLSCTQAKRHMGAAAAVDAPIWSSNQVCAGPWHAHCIRSAGIRHVALMGRL